MYWFFHGYLTLTVYHFNVGAVEYILSVVCRQFLIKCTSYLYGKTLYNVVLPQVFMFVQTLLSTKLNAGWCVCILTYTHRHDELSGYIQYIDIHACTHHHILQGFAQITTPPLIIGIAGCGCGRILIHCA